MLKHKLSGIIQDGIVEGQRLALTSDLWRCASASAHCDVLITINPFCDNTITKEFTLWLKNLIQQYEPQFNITIRPHHLTDSFGLYVTGSYPCLLRGAELCRLKKPVKSCFGGGTRDFSLDDAHCFQGLEIRSNFLSSMERSMIVKQMLEMMKAPTPDGIVFNFWSDSKISLKIADGSAIIQSLLSQKLINLLPLHQSESLAMLQKKWIFPVMDVQPINEIEEYFGTEIAMYFAWLGNLTTALWVPAVIGILMYCVCGFSFANNNDTEHSQFTDVCFVLFALTNCIWSSGYIELWKQRQAELAFQWGTYDLHEETYLSDPRTAFKGESLRPNPVSCRLEPAYPVWKHLLYRYGVGVPIIMLSVSLTCILMFWFMELQELAEQKFNHSVYFFWISYIPMTIYAVTILIGDCLYRKLAILLNDIENYRTDDEYESFLIQKTVIFQSVSAFGPLFYIVFYLNDLKRLQETLATLLITRQFIQNFIELTVPFFAEKLKVAKLTYRLTRSMSDHSLQQHADAARSRYYAQGTPDSLESLVRRRRGKPDDCDSDSLQNHLEITESELQSLMSAYCRPLDDFLEIFIQFGYVLLFSPAFPLAASCALLNNILEIRVDAFKLCNTVQRPFGRRVKSIGAWQKAMEFMGNAGVIVNCILIGKSGLIQRLYPNACLTHQIIFVVVLEHLIFCLKAWIQAVIPNVPQWISIELAKAEHWKREAYKRETSSLSNKSSPLPSKHDHHPQSCNALADISTANNNNTQKHLLFRKVRHNRSCTPAKKTTYDEREYHKLGPKYMLQ